MKTVGRLLAILSAMVVPHASAAERPLICCGGEAYFTADFPVEEGRGHAGPPSQAASASSPARGTSSSHGGGAPLLTKDGRLTGEHDASGAPVGPRWLPLSQLPSNGKPTWVHYTRKKTCANCIIADRLIVGKLVTYQSTFWNCVRIEYEADDTSSIVPADEFIAANGSGAFKIEGVPDDEYQYAMRLYDAFNELKAMKGGSQ